MSPLIIGLILVLAVAVVYIAMNYKQIRASIEMFGNQNATNTTGPASMAGNTPISPNISDSAILMKNGSPNGAPVAPNGGGNGDSNEPFTSHMNGVASAKKNAPAKKVPRTPGGDHFANPSEPSEVPFAAGNAPSNCYPKAQLNPLELLPADPNSKWAQVNPQGAGDIAGKNYLNAGALIGVNTVGQSLRNASWDLRSEPANPQVAVSPWFNSTIEPDVNRRTMEMA